MSNEKTALELVDELIEGKDRFVGTDELRDIKAAIEREHQQAVDNWAAKSVELVRAEKLRETEKLLFVKRATELQETIDNLEFQVKTYTRTIQNMNDRLKSAITLRPISELPDRVPDGCAIVLVSETCAFAVYENPASYPGWQGFYIIPFPPKAERRLHPCYMPGCGGSVTSINGVEKTDWRMMCTKCGMLGPIFNTKAKAELEWGYE